MGCYRGCSLRDCSIALPNQSSNDHRTFTRNAVTMRYISFRLDSGLKHKGCQKARWSWFPYRFLLPLGCRGGSEYVPDSVGYGKLAPSRASTLNHMQTKQFSSSMKVSFATELPLALQRRGYCKWLWLYDCLQPGIHGGYEPCCIGPVQQNKVSDYPLVIIRHFVKFVLTACTDNE